MLVYTLGVGDVGNVVERAKMGPKPQKLPKRALFTHDFGGEGGVEREDSRVH